MSPSRYRRWINYWPPFLFAGIAVKRASPDFREIEVTLRQRSFNRTPSGAHFGGSLFAMTDPFYALMLANALGRGYIIWDQAASIQFRSPGRGTVTAIFRLDAATIEAVRDKAASGAKVLQEFSAEIHDAAGTLVATVEKTVYVRKRPTAS
jgi:acyl-coenzyme A thioesterase PaaI-like protein